MTEFDKRLSELAKKFEKIGRDIDKIALKSIESKESVLEELNRGQMFEGIRSDGSEIRKIENGVEVDYIYAPFTIEKKIEKGQPTDRVTLKDEGDFYEALDYDFDIFGSGGASILITDSDSKTPELTQKYGIDIFGLTNKNIVILVILIEQSIASEIEKILLN